jgi:serine acetyltransferase
MRIVIGGDVVIGECATILSGCVIGEKYIDERSTVAYPTLGNHVAVGSSSIILGGITLGGKVNIGAGVGLIK